MSTRSLGTPDIRGNSLAELQRSTQFWMQQVFNQLDRISGARGTPTLYSNLDANGLKITNMGDAQGPTDAVPKKQTLTLTMNPENNLMQFDAQGVGIFNGAPGDHPADLVTLQQLRDEIVNALSTGGLGASFVTVTAEPLLANERQAAVQLGVLLLTDGGAGSTLTWSVVNNGIGNTQLRQGVATSLVGRSANSTGNLADIAASANGQVLRRAANALSFGQIDLADATNAVTGTLGVANGGTGLASYTTGDLVYASGATTLAKLADVATGSVLVSGGVGVAPVWSASPTITGPVIVGTDPGGANTLRVGGALTINSATLISTKTAFTNGAGAAAGTLLNAPAAGNPTKWVPFDDNGTTRYFPAW